MDTFDTLKIVKNGIELGKLQSPQNKGIKNSKNKPPKITKVISRKLKKFLVCCSVSIRLPR
jgi:hypothetical protein